MNPSPDTGACLDLGTYVRSLDTLIICVAKIHRDQVLSHVMVRDEHDPNLSQFKDLNLRFPPFYQVRVLPIH
jgi:hypothetical protein